MVFSNPDPALGDNPVSTDWQVITGDWREHDWTADHIICDPPYDARTHKGHAVEAWGKRAPFKREAVSFAPFDVCASMPDLLARSKRWTVCFCSLEMMGDYAATAGPSWIRAGVWVKVAPAPQFSGDRPATGTDGIAIMHPPGRKRWNNGGAPAVWYSMAPRGEHRYHETPKPVGLMMDLVEAFSDPGELICDPFCGSGTTGVACLRTGRRFLGYEINPETASTARERLEAEDRGLSLADAKRGQLGILDALRGEGCGE